MLRDIFRILRLAALGVLLPMPLIAAPGDQPNVVDVLFETKHLSNLEQGSEVKYVFKRTVSEPKLLGLPFDDEIKVAVAKVDPSGKRDLIVNVFTGDRAREPQSVIDMTGNPVLVLFLDRAVINFTQIAGGQLPYLKGKFRDALRDKAKIAAEKITYKGQTVDGFRITVQPYAGDLNALKMRGYDGAKFQFLVSDAVPGYFVELTSSYSSSETSAPSLEERIAVVGLGDAK